MRAIAVKEFLELRRDRRTLAMLFVLPFVFLVVFGAAASFDIKEVPTLVVGKGAPLVSAALPDTFNVISTDVEGDEASARDALRRGEVVVAVVTPAKTGDAPQVLVDGTEMFAAQAALRSISELRAKAAGLQTIVGAMTGSSTTDDEVRSTSEGDGTAIASLDVRILYNPDLRTAVIMVPGICGIILVFVGTVATALGVVRERQNGTMEQLAVMPFRPRDVFLGKIAPYLAIAVADMVVIVIVGMLLFDVPFRGSVATFALGAVLYLFTTLGIGVLISSVSQTQGQAIQLAMLTIMPQFLLSGLFFPLYSMPWAVRWIGYVLPLTYFVKVARGVMVRGAPIDTLWVSLVVLAVRAVGVFTASTLRFRRDLAPTGVRAKTSGPGASDQDAPAEATP